MNKTNRFKNLSVVLPPIKRGDKNISVNFLFDQLKKEDIAEYEDGSPAIKPGCNCTAVGQVLEDRIVIKYNDKSSDTDKSFSKTVRVFFDDGLPLYVKNERGVKVLNMNKDNQVLQFSGTFL